MDLYVLERQIRNCEADLAEEVRVGELNPSPFNAMRCERLYRTVAALQRRRNDLLERTRAFEPHTVPTGAPGNADVVLRRNDAATARKRRRRRSREWGSRELNHEKAVDLALGLGHGLDGQFYSRNWYKADHETPRYYDINDENSALPTNRLHRRTERWLGPREEFGENEWEWKGRTLRVVRSVVDRDADFLKQLLHKADSLEKRLAQLETKQAPTTSSVATSPTATRNAVIESAWDEETKVKVATGEALGEEQIRAREAARQKLQERAEQLNREIAENSAIEVQSAFRGFLGRKKMRDARKKYNAKIQHEGALIIQSRFRGHLAGKELLRLKRNEEEKMEAAAALTIQSQLRGRLARKQFLDAKTGKERKQAGAKMIQAWWRGCMGRIRVGQAKREYMQKAEHDAAIMFQCAYRCRLARKERTQLEAERTRAYEEAAAMMVQAAFRGMKARKHVSELRRARRSVDDQLQSMDHLDRVKKTFYAKKFLNVEQRAAVAIQAMARSFLERKRVGKLRRRIARERAEDKEIEELLRTQEQRRRGSKVVFEEELWVPLDSADGRRQETRVNVIVEEVKEPYQLKLEVQDLTTATRFQRAIDVGTLEQLLAPLYTDESIEMAPGPMREWVVKGRPPRRRELILWIMQRMWIEKDRDGHLELNVASAAVALPESELDKSLTAALGPSSPLSNRGLNRTIEATLPYGYGTLPKPSPLVVPRAKSIPDSKKPSSTRARESFVVRYAQP